MELTLEKAQPKATRRERWAWYLYDFGNSAYASVVLLAVFAVYFKEQVVGGAAGSRLWGLSLGIAMLVVAVISPVLGAIADYSGANVCEAVPRAEESCTKYQRSRPSTIGGQSHDAGLHPVIPTMQHEWREQRYAEFVVPLPQPSGELQRSQSRG